MREASSNDAESSAGRPPATVTSVAGQWMYRMGAITVPLYGAGAVVAHGFARWVMIIMGCYLALGTVTVKRDLRGVAPLALLHSAFAIVMWSWLQPDAPELVMVNFVATVAFMAFVMPRPYAQISLGALPITFATGQLTVGSGAGQWWSVAGSTVAATTLGALLLGIRFATERAVTGHAQALSAANAKLEVLHRTDELTGLANRRQLNQALADVWNRAAATGEPVGVAMVDIDHFKQYNDHYGHVGGDDCLRTVAATVVKSVREADLVFRYGGEEFLIILPNASLAAVEEVSERVRLNVACRQLEHTASPGGFVSISLGAASALHGDGITAEELTRQADRGLYEAKRNGRNRVGVVPSTTLEAVPVR